MPKINDIQTRFTGGEFSPMMYGYVNSDRYKTGLQTCLNYIPTIQGPLVRRPGTKYVNNVKDASEPPGLLSFKFSETQSYVMEFGNQYVRFYANGGQVITNSNIFTVNGKDSYTGLFAFTAVRTSALPRSGEVILGSSVLAAGSSLELVSPYLYSDVPGIKYAQKGDTVYLTHPRYPVYKLQRGSINNEWSFKKVQFVDGPLLPLNSYAILGDSVPVTLVPSSPGSGVYTTGPQYLCSSIQDNGAGVVRVFTTVANNHQTGDSIVIGGSVMTGSAFINNDTVSISRMSWKINVISAFSFDLLGSQFSGSYVGSGIVYPALFQPNPIVPGFVDVGRTVRLINVGYAFPGNIFSVTDMKQCNIILNPPEPTFANTSAITVWQMGVWKDPVLPSPNFPNAVCFYQDRLAFAGSTQQPEQINLSMTGDYEHFSASGSSLQVTDNNAIQLNLSSSDLNKLFWLKSSAQGLLSASLSGEWQISPNTQTAALTPTNVSATETSSFGSADIDAVQSGNGTLYVQRAGRKVREMSFFFQVGTFRSSDLTEIAEHITIPSITKLAVQKETLPLVWGIRSDGIMVAMSYSRDDQTLHAGWARHILGGQSDSAGTNPIVRSIAVMPSRDTSFDQLWVVVQRSTISGSTFTSIEYMTKPYDDSVLQEDAFQGDCGATYDTPITVGSISSASSAIVSANSHGLSNNDQIRITSVVGLNNSVIDALGNQNIFNLVNEKTFVVGSSLTNSFALLDFNGNAVNSLSYGSYVGSGYVRKMVLNITGLDWLKGETVGVLADGAIHPDCVVNSGGGITLQYRAAKVQIGYRYNSDGSSLRTPGGSAQGTSIGETRRVSRVAPQFHNMGDFSMGSTFADLQTVQFQQADVDQLDQATPLFSGIHRDSIGSPYSFDDNVCWRQNSMLPGMLQSITYFIEVQDV